MGLTHAKGVVVLRGTVENHQPACEVESPPSVVVANHGLNEVNFSSSDHQ